MSKPVNVIPSREARAHLGTMLSRFRAGDTEPMYFGAHRKPEAAVIPFDRYMELLELEEVRAVEEAFVNEVRDRIARADADPDSVVSISLEDLAADLGPLAEQYLEDAKAADAAAQPRLAHG